jgi:regulator of sigma E protease
MLTFIIVLIGLSLLILGHEAAHFFMAKMFGMKVDEFGIGFPPRIVGKKFGETTYTVNWLPFGGFVKIAGEEISENPEAIPSEERRRYFFAQPAWRRALVIAAGVLFNFIFGWILVSVIFAIGTPGVLGVRAVLPDSPAAKAGVQAGDFLKDFGQAQDFISFVKEHPTTPAEFTVLRDNREIAISAQPVVEEGVARIGIELEEGGRGKVSVPRAFKEGFEAAIQVCYMTLKAFYDLVKNLFVHASLLEGVVGPVGIFSVAHQTSRFGLIYLFQLLGIISLNLSIANLIPFPALDGGRLLLILIEKIKGSPVSKRTEGWINGVGFSLLILLMVLVTVRDVGKLIR